MSDNDSGGVTRRVTPKRGRAALSDLTLIVRPPGRPADIRVFAGEEVAEAEEYARANGSEVERLQ
ncbi:hypothetical protein M0655_23290 (plasmid) [Gordonia amicalis]|nr:MULTISPECIES: hypothetical protein [Gordonia]MDH3026203.1 hypothetical protein [Gordonia alkanivorans]NKX79859.1 hypothetical protein [Gordonia amicalis]UOG23697.1 hypothetical protein MTX80_22575 [Gordonia amicalis]UPW16428.1 hypothetical protein M0655_23290 [Gordonia amicalis]GAC55247.1 hypothetical protein GOAMI_49_00140 [Gordonia amicalis NBRC 100051 = JCM 11271]